MGWLHSSKHPDRIVDAGRVFCPASHHDVDVDRCLGCPRLDATTVDAQGALTHIRCDVSGLAGLFVGGQVRGR